MDSPDRASALRDYVQRPDYVCSIGSRLVRQGRFPLFEMPEEVEGHQAVARDAIRALLQLGRGSAVGVLYPSEPASYEELQTLHRTVHATVFAAAVAESALTAYKQRTFRLPRRGQHVQPEQLPTLARSVRQQNPAPFIAMEGIRVIADMGIPVQEDPYASFENIRAAVAALLSVDPNIAPGVDNQPLQAIVLSPQYVGDATQEIQQLLATAGLPNVPHGRFAPVTAMVLNFHADVMEALQSVAGAQIRQRMTMGASITRYRSMDVLAEKPDAKKRLQYLRQILKQS